MTEEHASFVLPLDRKSPCEDSRVGVVWHWAQPCELEYEHTVAPSLKQGSLEGKVLGSSH